MNWLTTLKTLAPTVASAMLGPLGGVAVSALGTLLGVPDATQAKIADAIQTGQMTPEQISALKTLELQYQDNEKERGFKYAELEFADVADARKRDTAFLTAGLRNYRSDLMFLLAVVGIAALVWIIWKDPGINEYVKGIFTLVLGRFLSYLDAIYNFEYSSTRSGRVKDSTIENLTKPAP